MATDYDRFWGSVAVLAQTFRADDPHMTGKLHELAHHLATLPPAEQHAIRLDLQLLIAHFSKLGVALAALQQPDEEMRVG